MDEDRMQFGSTWWQEEARAAKAWPFREAVRLAAHLERRRARQTDSNDNGAVATFQTGYGPSGLPHIGTFGEVARTSMVQKAWHALTGQESRLVVFSDDLDGLRKVPDNVPDPERLADCLDLPLSAIPDPFGQHESYAAHNNARLRSFLDRFGFTYEFVSATEAYRAGRFDPTLKSILEHAEAIRELILPELGAERRKSYSPFLPICARTGKVRQVAIEAHDARACTIVWRDPDTGQRVEQSVLGGSCKLQWRVDWAMRWIALGIDYEMSGKDLSDSVRLSGGICRLLNHAPPLGLTYELFLDENGEKISKSRGNGLTIEEWLAYGSPQSLSMFMYQKPQTARRLYFGMIPRTTDEYLGHLDAARTQQEAPLRTRLDNPVWHVHGGEVPQYPEHPSAGFSYSLLMNLAAACDAREKHTLWGFVQRMRPGLEPEDWPLLDAMLEDALRYSADRVLPFRKRRPPDAAERGLLQQLRDQLADQGDQPDATEIQNLVYALGREGGYDNLRDWFRALYQILLGQDDGPRFGSLVALHGIAETIALIDRALEDAKDPA